MNKTKFMLVGALCASLSLAACSGNKGQNAVSASDSVAATAVDSASALGIDSVASSLSWKGFKPGGGHSGVIPVSVGSVDIKDGALFAGNVTIDLKNLVVEDLKPEEGGDKLKEHLLSEDFFDVAKYPTVKFELTNLPAEGVKIADLKELQGNLTLKDVTKNITIPVESASQNADGSFTIKSKSFTINRADWNVKYGSKSFFSNLGDKVIDDNIELSFTLKTK